MEERIKEGSYVYSVDPPYVFCKVQRLKDDEALLELDDGTRVWANVKNVCLANRCKKYKEGEMTIHVSQSGFFSVHYNGKVAENLNFEEMLGCVIRSYSKYMGDKERYFLAPKTEVKTGIVDEIDFSDIQ
jgi:hypothetical protein